MKRNVIKLMEVCGTHTMAIARSGIRKVIPGGIELISGPGCPVCVTSQKDIDRAIMIAREKDVVMTTFGDMMRVPGSRTSLEGVKGLGADVKVVYSPLDAVSMAKDAPDKNVVFMGVGFETTSPLVASAVIEAKKRDIRNFSVLSNFKLVFPALEAIAGSEKIAVDGFICPGHVSVITGSAPYEDIARRFGKPCVITGFGQADIIKGITRLVDQINRGDNRVEIEYKRAVTNKGNTRAKSVLDEVFSPSDAEWRGLGKITKSGLKFRDDYSFFDAKNRFPVKVPEPRVPKGCICAEVLQGISRPGDCRLFGKACTPSSPVGPCMVSSEGSCAAQYRYGE
ncbi:MAG: hydrogenase formation protein HypD [Candidatus Omnitrophica bacterium]|nr:hydrogenase formation protein HypD [Candidatus Omnitrophota bacterium]